MIKQAAEAEQRTSDPQRTPIQDYLERYAPHKNHPPTDPESDSEDDTSYKGGESEDGDSGQDSDSSSQDSGSDSSGQDSGSDSSINGIQGNPVTENDEDTFEDDGFVVEDDHYRKGKMDRNKALLFGHPMIDDEAEERPRKTKKDKAPPKKKRVADTHEEYLGDGEPKKKKKKDRVDSDDNDFLSAEQIAGMDRGQRLKECRKALKKRYQVPKKKDGDDADSDARSGLKSAVGTSVGKMRDEALVKYDQERGNAFRKDVQKFIALVTDTLLSFVGLKDTKYHPDPTVCYVALFNHLENSQLLAQMHDLLKNLGSLYEGPISRLAKEAASVMRSQRDQNAKFREQTVIRCATTPPSIPKDAACAVCGSQDVATHGGGDATQFNYLQIADFSRQQTSGIIDKLYTRKTAANLIKFRMLCQSTTCSAIAIAMDAFCNLLPHTCSIVNCYLKAAVQENPAAPDAKQNIERLDSMKALIDAVCSAHATLYLVGIAPRH